MRHILIALSVGWISLGLAGCSSMSPSNGMPHGDLTMSQIYQGSTQGGASYQEGGQESQVVLPRPYAGVVSTGPQVVHGIAELPNPAIDVYVSPHFVQAGDQNVLIPGYTTAFFMYNRPHFALPTEHSVT